ncbi:hypothetical protein [Thermococcus sp.]|uniref:hypothetical protein n=1 Tax=Thermococcus sp. TaxID=35749 RepID=UPI00263172A8|nr:hypothetical protein [Thermococcus sp.]
MLALEAVCEAKGKAVGIQNAEETAGGDATHPSRKDEEAEEEMSFGVLPEEIPPLNGVERPR